MSETYSEISRSKTKYDELNESLQFTFTHIQSRFRPRLAAKVTLSQLFRYAPNQHAKILRMLYPISQSLALHLNLCAYLHLFPATTHHARMTLVGLRESN